MSNEQKAKQKSSLMQEYSALLGDAVLRKRTRAAEQRARLESELADRVRSEFISNMTHELRTPLNTVMGFSKLLSEHGTQKVSDADIVQYAGLIYDAGTHLLAVINDILDISRMRSGNYALEADEVDVASVLRDCVEAAQSAAAAAGVTIEEAIAFDLPHVRGDERKLAQVFGNLVSNGIKFTQPGGKVTIAAGGQTDASLRISISDTGVGMSEDDIRLALEPFGQVDGRRTRWREGTGLGLPIAKALVELHRGQFMISSVKGSGTTVSVVLPSVLEVSIAQARAAVFGHGLSL